MRTPSPDGEVEQSTFKKVRNLRKQKSEFASSDNIMERGGQRFEEPSFYTMAAIEQQMQKHKK